jgi:hypothetical protein
MSGKLQRKLPVPAFAEATNGGRIFPRRPTEDESFRGGGESLGVGVPFRGEGRWPSLTRRSSAV